MVPHTWMACVGHRKVSFRGVYDSNDVVALDTLTAEAAPEVLGIQGFHTQSLPPDDAVSHYVTAL